MRQLMKPRLKRERVDRINRDRAVPGVAEAVAIGGIEGDLLDAKPLQGSLSVPARDLRLWQRLALGLAQDEPAGLVDETGQDLALTLLVVCLGLPLDGDRACTA